MGFLDFVKKIPSVQRSLLENDQKRFQLSEDKRASANRQSLSGILTNAGNPNQGQGALLGQNSPQFNNRIMGLLAGIPGQEANAISGLLGGGQKQSAAMTTMQAMGYPQTPEGYSAYKAAGNQPTPDDAIRLQQSQIQLEQMRADMVDAQAARDLTEEDRERTKSRGEIDLRGMLSEVQNAQDAVSGLEGSILEAGVPMADFREAFAGGLGSILSLAGVAENPTVSRRVRTQYDLAKKSFQRLTNAEAKRVSGGQAVTNAAREAASGATPSLDMTYGAIGKTLSFMTGLALEEGRASGFDIDESPYQKIMKPFIAIPGFENESAEDQAYIAKNWFFLTKDEQDNYLSGGTK